MSIEDESVDQAVECTEDRPFLRITSTSPADTDRIETIMLELNLRDDEPVGEYDPDRPGEREAARSWVLDLVVTAIREMRGGGRPPVVTVDGRGVPKVLADRLVHVPGCTGDCGMLPPPGFAAQRVTDEDLRIHAGPGGDGTPGYPGSGRWTGGDGKDAR